MQIKELGHVVLYVTNLERSANFYRDVLGFREITRQDGIAVSSVAGAPSSSDISRRTLKISAFSSGRTHHELLLIEIGGEPELRRRPKPGLYHIGFKIGDGPEAARQAYRELKAQGVPILGASDHGVTHSIYILDPDGNELELYADVSDEWKQNPRAVLAPIKPLDLS